MRFSRSYAGYPRAYSSYRPYKTRSYEPYYGKRSYRSYSTGGYYPRGRGFSGSYFGGSQSRRYGRRPYGMSRPRYPGMYSGRGYGGYRGAASPYFMRRPYGSYRRYRKDYRRTRKYQRRAVRRAYKRGKKAGSKFNDDGPVGGDDHVKFSRPIDPVDLEEADREWKRVREEEDEERAHDQMVMLNRFMEEDN